MMKRIAVFLTILIALVPTFALANVQYSQWKEVEGQGDSVSFYIDSKNVYGGMERAYKDGYSPVVSGDKARIILPLLSSGQMSGNSIVATPNLGDPSTSPFVFNNYQKRVSVAEHTVNNGKNKVQAYYVAFDLPLSSSRANGSYPVEITVSGNDQSGNPVSQAFTTYVRITGVEPDSPPIEPPIESPPAEEKPQSKPILLVASSEISPSPINAGDEFTARVVVKNTSSKKAV